MPAFKLPDGRVLVPVRAESDDRDPDLGPSIVGDAVEIVAADSPEAKHWEPWTIPASDQQIEYFSRKS